MLVIKNVKIVYERNVVPVRIRTINIGYKKEAFNTKRKYLQTDTHTFTWNQDITLPLYYNVPLRLICKADDLYYNPQDPNSELHCLLKINDYKATTQTGTLINRHSKPMATVSITYRVANEKLILSEERGLAVISSILAHMNHQKGSTGYIEITLGNKEIYTPTVNFVAGELLWGQQLTIPVQDYRDKHKTKHKLTFTIYIDDEPKGQGTFMVQNTQKSSVKYKKIQIVDIFNQQNRLGTLFIDINFRDIKQQNQQSTVEIGKLESGLTNVLAKKKKTDFFLHSRQNSQNFFNPKTPMTANRQQLPTPMISSRSETKLLRPYNSDQTAKLLQKFSQKKQKKVYDFDAAIFKIGQFSNQQQIKHALRDRRKKEKHQGSLPKLIPKIK